MFGITNRNKVATDIQTNMQCIQGIRSNGRTKINEIINKIEYSFFRHTLIRSVRHNL